MKQLAVIILNWNGKKLLQQFLPIASRFTIDEDTDLFVADNGSTDDSLEWIRKNHPEVKIISFSKNLGFSEGYNRAIAQTAYPFTILLNDDVEVTQGWTRPLLRFMQENPEAGACQPKIRSWRNREYFEYAGAAGGFLDRNGYPYCRGRLFSSIEKDEGQYDTPPLEITWASGAAMMVRTQLYLSLGGLDRDFFAHMEEIDLCCRMAGAGYKIYALSDSMVYHVGGASLEQGNPKKTYLNFRNNLLLLHKNLPKAVGSKKLFKRRLLDTLAFFAFLAKADFGGAGAILRAHKDFRKMKKNYTSLPEKNYLSALPGAERNILTDYYLHHKRK